jgi:hypothetical protein
MVQLILIQIWYDHWFRKWGNYLEKLLNVFQLNRDTFFSLNDIKLVIMKRGLRWLDLNNSHLWQKLIVFKMLNRLAKWKKKHFRENWKLKIKEWLKSRSPNKQLEKLNLQSIIEKYKIPNERSIKFKLSVTPLSQVEFISIV